ncbi:MAG: hypothetical protein METHSR3v1_990009 [Methanothrix sp.]|nr:MAG: hypothetical protein METHSR3v1_990009 [Methanothrix sp.]
MDAIRYQGICLAVLKSLSLL